MELTDARYLLGGVSLAVRATDAGVARLADSRFQSLRDDAAGDEPDIVIELRGPGADPRWPETPAGAGRTVYDAPDVPIEYFADADSLFVDFKQRARMLCAPAQGRIQMSITGDEPGDPVLATHPLLTIALLETMKRFGRYPLHAAGLSLDGKGVLVAGSSGAGKSTLSVTLVRAGFGFLADDTVFLDPDTEGLVVSGFPDEVDVTDGTVAMFPELAHLAGRSLHPGRDKHGFRVEEVFGVAPLPTCRPAVLVSPRVERGATPRAEPLSPAEALLELTPNVLLTEPVSVQSHLDALACLVKTVPCFSLRLGEDTAATAACVEELVA
jgi:hypothetical protein